MKTRSPSPETPLRIGTRGSPLALAQARETRTRLMAAHDLAEAAFEIVVIRTTGDMTQDRPLRDLGGKGLFTREIETALLSGEIDLAVHSMKDVPTILPDGLIIDCFLPREDMRDGLIPGGTVAGLRKGAVVGTSSLRRRAQLLYRRPDLLIVEFRGNVQTRLNKLEQGVAEATLLAMAGILRLGLTNVPVTPLSTDELLPAVAQGAIGVERRQDDEVCAALLAAIGDTPTKVQLAAERAFLARLEGSCQTPIAGLAEIAGASLRFRGEIIRPDGSQCLQHEITGMAADAARIGQEAADVLRGRAGPGFFA